MIKLAIIAPYAYMKDLCPLGHIELAFSHLMAEEGSIYSEYYYKARALGRQIILDNGVMEMGHADQSDALLDIATRLRPRFLTPPEILHDGTTTLNLTRTFAERFIETGLYPQTELLGVAHGSSFQEWVRCFIGLREIASVGRIGIPYDLRFDVPGQQPSVTDSPLEAMVARRVALCEWIAANHPGQPVHLLGLAHPGELRIQCRHSFVVSNDSSISVVSALHGVRFTNESPGPYEKHFIDFSVDYNPSLLTVAKANVAAVLNYASC